MSNHDHQRAPEDAAALAARNNLNTMYEQNNSSEEELEVIINGQATPFDSGTTPDDFSDTGDEDGVVYEIKAMTADGQDEEQVKLCAVNVTGGGGGGLRTPENNGPGTVVQQEGDAGVEADTTTTFRRPSTAEKRKRPIDHHEENASSTTSMFDLLPGPPLNFCTSPPLEAVKPHRSHSTTHILMHHSNNYNNNNQRKPAMAVGEDTENMMVTSEDAGAAAAAMVAMDSAAGDKNQSTNRRLSGPILNSSAKQHLYVSNCAGFKPAAMMRRSFRTEPTMTSPMGGGHNERWSVVGTGAEEGNATGDDGDSEVERFNFEGIQISYSSPSLLPTMASDSDSPPAAKLFHCEASVSPKRRPLKHHNHQRLQRLQRPCLDFDKMQQLKTRPVTSSWQHNNEEMSVFCW